MSRQDAIKSALFNVRIETPSGVLLDVKDISHDDAWDHCEIILKEHPDEEILQTQLKSCMRYFGIQGYGGQGYFVSISAHGKFIKDPTGEMHTCGRRAENFMDRDDSPFKGSGKNLDSWDLRGEDLCCSYCGSIKPSRVLELVKQYGPKIINVSDKDYKWYIERPQIINAGFGGIKYYRQHDTREFIDELRGVYVLKNRTKCFSAVLIVDYKRLFLGNFFTEKEAAIAYNKAAIEHIGEFAFLNKI